MTKHKIGDVMPSIDNSGTWDVYLGNGDGYSTKDQDHAMIIGMLAKLLKKNR